MRVTEFQLASGQGTRPKSLVTVMEMLNQKDCLDALEQNSDKCSVILLLHKFLISMATALLK